MQQIFHFPNTRRVLLNTLRRTILRDLPTLAFPRSSVKVQKLVCKMLDDEIIALRISTIPIPPLSDDSLFMACDARNTTENDIVVTTSDCTYWSEDQKRVNNPFTRPIQICPLSTGEMIQFTAVAIQATPASFSSSSENEGGFLHTPCSKCFFHEDGKFTIHPRRGYNATDILLDALEVIRTRVASCEADTTKGGTIVFRDDRYTMPMLLSEYLREETEVEFVAARCKHLLEAEGEVTFKLREGAGSLDIRSIINSARTTIFKELSVLHKLVAAFA